MEDLQGFPKFQWSMFIGDKEQQIVVRGNDFEAFVEDVEQTKAQFNGTPTMSRTAEKLVAKVENHTRVCESCGSEMVQKSGTKNGKAWSGWFCSKKCGANPVWG